LIIPKQAEAARAAVSEAQGWTGNHRLGRKLVLQRQAAWFLLAFRKHRGNKQTQGMTLQIQIHIKGAFLYQAQSQAVPELKPPHVTASHPLPFDTFRPDHQSQARVRSLLPRPSASYG